MISRRSVVGGLAALPLVHALPSGLFAVAAPAGRILVVGAGLSGLAAAWELVEQGHDVTVVESANAPGGRILTLREGFADGLWAEAGGDVIGGTYDTLLGYARRFGLSLVPGDRTPGGGGDVLVGLGDRRHRLSALRRDPSAWALDLTDAERRAAPFGLIGLYLGPLAREIGAPGAVLDDAHARYDTLSLHDLLLERGASAAAIALVEVALNYNDTRTVSALSVLRDLTRRLRLTGTWRLQGGNDTLVYAFAKRLGPRILYGCRLRAIEDHGDRVSLQVERHGEQDTIVGDAAIVTLPFPALRGVQWHSALPDARREMIETLPYTRLSKTFVQTRKRFWRGEAPLAAVWTDGRFERLFDVSPPGDGRGLLVGWINGTGAEALDRLPVAEHGAAVAGHVRRLFPEYADLVEGTRTVRWAASYAGGAYAHYAPGQLRAFAPSIGKPVGRVAFAGEHTELEAPGMEGALRSGVRAAGDAVRLLG